MKVKELKAHNGNTENRAIRIEKWLVRSDSDTGQVAYDAPYEPVFGLGSLDQKIVPSDSVQFGKGQ